PWTRKPPWRRSRHAAGGAPRRPTDRSTPARYARGMPTTGSGPLASRLVALGFAALVAVLAPSAGLAEPSSPAADQVRQPAVTPSAASEYNRGVRARLAKDWATAVEAFRAAIAAQAAFPAA